MTKGGLFSDISMPPDDNDESAVKGYDWAQREYAIGIMLDQISRDLEIRNRVRDHLKSLPSDKPGRRVKLQDQVVYHLVEGLRAHGHTLESAYQVIARDGVTAESVRKKYISGKRIARQRGKN